MSENKLIIEGTELVRNAFYAMPDFTDNEGNHISVIYGAFFKLKELLEKGASSLEVTFEGDKSSFTKDVLGQIRKNTLNGIYGTLENNELIKNKKEYIDIAYKDEIKTGKRYIG